MRCARRRPIRAAIPRSRCPRYRGDARGAETLAGSCWSRRRRLRQRDRHRTVATTNHRPSDPIGAAFVVTTWTAAIASLLVLPDRRRQPDPSTKRAPSWIVLGGLVLIVAAFVGVAATIVAIRRNRLDTIELGGAFLTASMAIGGPRSCLRARSSPYCVTPTSSVISRLQCHRPRHRRLRHCSSSCSHRRSRVSTQSCRSVAMTTDRDLRERVTALHSLDHWAGSTANEGREPRTFWSSPHRPIAQLNPFVGVIGPRSGCCVHVPLTPAQNTGNLGTEARVWLSEDDTSCCDPLTSMSRSSSPVRDSRVFRPQSASTVPDVIATSLSIGRKDREDGQRRIGREHGRRPWHSRALFP